MNSADPPTNPGHATASAGSLTPTAEFLLQRYRPVYNYANTFQLAPGMQVRYDRTRRILYTAADWRGERAPNAPYLR